LIKRIIRWIRNAVITFLGLIILYIFIAVQLTIFPANEDYKPPAGGIAIYIVSNDVHTDFVLPVNIPQKNWIKDFPLSDFSDVDSTFKYISFGWGDKEFYLNTPTWSDFKLDIALKALFLSPASLMHIEYLRSSPMESDLSKKILVTVGQYNTLVNYLENSFKKNKNGNYILIKVPFKSSNENYYESDESYNFINTCNNWTNQGIKSMGIKTATWAPFDRCIFYHF
jgi:uncharacterized protein (TIGR02117 family)